MGSRRGIVPSVDLGLGLELTHVGSPYYWSTFPGVRHWSAELSVADDAVSDSPRIVIGTADFVCVDTIECDDFFVDIDSFSADLGQMADVVRRKVLESEELIVGDNIRVLFVVDVALDPHWRGRGLGPAVVKMVARALGLVDVLALIPAALRTVRGDDGIWRSTYDRPRPGSAAQTKVRKAWKAAGFVPGGRSVYLLRLDDGSLRQEAAAARQLLQRLRFTRADRDWWKQLTG